MNTHVKNISIERLESHEVNNIIEKFTSCGWHYNGSWQHSTHIFAAFIWDKDSEPIYPGEYQ